MLGWSTGDIRAEVRTVMVAASVKWPLTVASSADNATRPGFCRKLREYRIAW